MRRLLNYGETRVREAAGIGRELINHCLVILIG